MTGFLQELLNQLSQDTKRLILESKGIQVNQATDHQDLDEAILQGIECGLIRGHELT